MTYKEKHLQMNREARATFIAGVVVMVFWWLSGFGLASVPLTVLSMPLWFVVSCFGSWFLAIAVVVFITKRVFRDIPLDDE